ncbi:MAG: hypothetical protein A3B10_02195 [Candidatus Doudnabacteria bacterium RIFCSPLOWO2_01_FULL_44_21]|uniref:UDP-N-acetylglucosamine--N-acetylmuramyl-(pentapeptide) pyrophosphoryl-undecaprenol N-acetylglucosamine transferase n=1 Tax=Candidatus Doudnabacteria bacterium RIFCSPLOWO2_01_FULL_44_21 TaxID=1817841 RepID=A0A1F5Q5E9_9BACT|nr:MAG: hypothetical protein A3B95_01105 [Candidatus Doudnabacteria bacterium RIFCSPHIGHO2_02_FULL_43_13b]OGE97383.1 MAG: hypothetical protein A3B10_02195 [Candidatus Doudnabacteria bacterium RIFCSPLOWO2_01_FULL_44_21]
MKILLTGGGSGGPVSPVLAVAEAIKKVHPKTQFLFVGTKKGPEREMVEQVGIRFVSIPASKWRRYFTWRNILAPIVLLFGFFSAYFVVSKFRPNVVFSAGGFVGVPVCWAAKIFKIKIVIHQQDARVGLANKLVAPFADQITTTFEGTAKQFYSGSGLFDNKLKPRAEWVGNPVRPTLQTSKADVNKYFQLHDRLPILLVLGGATGSDQINQLIEKILPQLIKSHQVVHQTGKNKNYIKFKDPNYHAFELIPFLEYAAILKAAHLVIARAGLSTIAELSALGKTAIIIPMPQTHQEDNAKILIYTNSAVVLFGQSANSDNLIRAINHLKFNPTSAKTLAANISQLMPKDAADRIAKIVLQNGRE